MIVPDGRTNLEKLKELLGNPEQTHLDLKASVDLTNAADKLKFVKDAVTMASRPEGGYILIGVDDAGAPCLPVGTIADRARFDGSRVGALIRSFVEAAVHVVVEIHELANHEIVVIYVRNPDGLPVPFNRDGQHPGRSAGDKDVTVFRKGEIFVREGAENVPIRYAHWADLLATYTRGIRDQSTEAALSMLREVLTGRDGAAGDAGVPLLAGMDETTFAATAARLLEIGNDVRLRQYLRTVSRSTGASVDLATYADALNRWAIFCAQTLYFERPDLTDEAIGKLVESYQGLGISTDDNQRRLMIVERIYVVGSLAVRLGEWETVRSLALRPVPGNSYETDYIYSSWIRAAQVYASRAGLTEDPRGDYLLSAARELMVEHPAMRPDLTDTAVPPEEATSSDPALNSLCEFDLAYCIVVAALGTDRGAGYPSSAAFDEDRAKPVAQKIVKDPEMRHRLLPDVDDPAVADALFRTYEQAIRQSATSSYGTRWWAMPPSVDAFVGRHRRPAV
ncbi:MULTISPECIES: helix-turn-helix domain-containing protein [Mycobacteriaceae]|uniref:ATP-binding protein n=1 Tax=Mycolicibacterium parafortuitum TaxID=39692 RepID=A0ACC6MI37_MYCPF|nr:MULTISPECIES: ATP-binding protein [Mycobacteriaceae]MDZ5086548.1 ATP-binding protein [Mycolicibacterium parafortuitum]GFM20413.1 putative transcriptional regulator with HTH doma in [Mycobacterium sp. PO1]GFM24562.1 putative transcriptional regulator with HTH doma in [Mycobacterium sp. PO2]